MASIYDIATYDPSKNTYVENEIVHCGECLNSDPASASGRFYYNLGYSIAVGGNTNGLRPEVTDGHTYWGGYTPYGTTNTIIPHFFWIPSYAPSITSEPKVDVIEFGDGYEQRTPQGISNALLSISLNFEKRNEAEAEAIAHFLHARGAKEAFAFLPPSPYASMKKFVCKSWDVSLNFQDNYTIQATFREVVE